MTIAGTATVAPLDAARVADLLTPSCWRIHWLPQCDSTNSQLLAQAAAHTAHQGEVLIAEVQTQGRGRLGRAWQHTANALTFSLLWKIPPNKSGLTLAIGVALQQALTTLGACELQLKWPNDLWWRERKMAGVLVECANVDASNTLWAVIGIGLNYNQRPDLLGTACLAEAMATGQALPEREKVLAALLAALAPALQQFCQQGFAPFRTAWMAHHALMGRPVAIRQGEKFLRGHCSEVNEEGQLALDNESGRHWIMSGDVEKA